MKPGGLPLEMCRRNKEEEYYDEREDGPSSLFLPLVASSSQPPVLPIREQIRQRLLNKLEEMDRSGRINKAAQPVAQRPTECTIHFEQKEPMAGLAAEKVEKPEYRSLTARQEINIINETSNIKMLASFSGCLPKQTLKTRAEPLRSMQNLKQWFANFQQALLESAAKI